jgi:hypothetical protein
MFIIAVRVIESTIVIARMMATGVLKKMDAPIQFIEVIRATMMRSSIFKRTSRK